MHQRRPTATPIATAGPGSFPSSWWQLPIVIAGGIALAALARLWMRWISDDPEFSWSGTIAIAVVITLFVTAQGVAAVFRRRPHRRSAVSLVRVVCGVLSLGIFFAAGAVMLPTVAGGGLALWRSDWHRYLRGLVGLIAFAPVVFVAIDIGDLGYNPAWLGRVALFLTIYAVFTLATWPTIACHPDGHRLSPAIRVALIVVIVLAVGLLGLAVVGISGG